MSKDKSGICRLCKKDTILCDSHIFPKFVFKWMKKTGSGNFRIPTSVNMRRQDGPTVKMLCRNCEEIFNFHETWFAKEMFHPILDEMLKNDGQLSTSVTYNEQYYKFVVSLLWRLLVVNMDSGDYNRRDKQRLEQVAEEWRLFLLESKYPLNSNKIHYLITDIVNDFPNQPERFNFYMARSTDGTIGDGNGRLMVYAKIARFIFFCLLEGFDDEKFVNTKINPLAGTLVTPQQIRDGEFGAFVISRVEAMNKFSENLSKEQKQKIVEKAIQEQDKLINSDLHRAVSNDK